MKAGNRRLDNQGDIVRKRRAINGLLLVVFCTLLMWVVLAVRAEIERVYRATQPLTATRIQIVRDADRIDLTYADKVWQMQQPYQHLASQAVVEALLARLQNACRRLDDVPTRTPQRYANIIIDDAVYHIGERNDASDEVYVLHDNRWQLCDKLLLSMAMAPAINFIDKQLYHGELTAIIGDFGKLNNFEGIDLSVLEIAAADADALPKNAISTLTFVAAGEADDTANQRVYQAFLSQDSQHLLLFDQNKGIIYVVVANAKLNAVLGL